MTHPGDCEADAASAALASYCPGSAARVTVIPVTQVGVQGSHTGYTPRKQQRTQQDECPSWFKLWGQHYMLLPAQLHASAALAPYCLKNCDADAAGQKLENLFKRGMVWERARSSRREGWGPAGGCAGPKEG